MEEQQAQASVDKAAEGQGRVEEAERTRRRQALEMQRERILSERTSSPHRRSALEMALADVEERLSELGWSVHL